MSYMQRLKIMTSRSTPWDYSKALQLMNQIFGHYSSFRASIRATADGIGWYLDVRRADVPGIMRTISALYPDAQVNGVDSTDLSTRYYVYTLEALTPFSLPLAHEFSYDPLTLLVGQLEGLEPGNELIYEMIVDPPAAEIDYRRLGLEVLMESNVKLHNFLTQGGMDAAYDRMQTGNDVEFRFGEESLGLARNKLNKNLRDVRLVLKSRRPWDDRFWSVYNAFDHFTDPVSNALVPSAFEEAFPLVLCPEEAAALWHLPTSEMTSRKIEYVTTAEPTPDAYAAGPPMADGLPRLDSPRPKSTIDSDGDESAEVVKLIESLAKLHAQGVLTDEEFHTKKRDLLSRL